MICVEFRLSVCSNLRHETFHDLKYLSIPPTITIVWKFEATGVGHKTVLRSFEKERQNLLLPSGVDLIKWSFKLSQNPNLKGGRALCWQPCDAKANYFYRISGCQGSGISFLMSSPPPFHLHSERWCQSGIHI
jgi:hypothetical protein